MLQIFNTIKKNIHFIGGVLMVLFLCLWLQQCNVTKDMKNQLATTQHIAEQNIAALADNTIQLRVTKEQLANVDSYMHEALVKIDSLGDIKSTTITVTNPVYVGKDVVVPNNLLIDTPKQSYGLQFTSEDAVRTINGVSWFKFDTNKNSIVVTPENTDIKDFKLNFSLVISQYEDQITKYTRTKIIPFNVKSDGSLGDQIPESLLKINFRNAEILDKPFTPNKPSEPTTSKGKFKSGWGVSLNPVGVGVSNGKFIVTPNISFGYYITLR
jgi:hypothetical protein